MHLAVWVSLEMGPKIIALIHSWYQESFCFRIPKKHRMSPHHCSIAVDLQRLLLGTSHLRKIVGGHKPHGSPNRTWNSKSCPTQTSIHFLLQSLMRLYQIHDKFDNFTRWNLNHNVEMAVYWVLHESSIQSRQKFVAWPTKRPNPPCGHGEKHPHRGFPWQTWKGQQSSAFLLLK